MSDKDSSPNPGDPGNLKNDDDRMDVDHTEEGNALLGEPEENDTAGVFVKRISSFTLSNSDFILEGNVYDTELSLDNNGNSGNLTVKDIFKKIRGQVSGKNGEGSAVPIGYARHSHFGTGDSNDSPPPDPPPPKLTFADCGGLEKQIRFLQSALISTLNGNNALYNKFHLQAPKGILFYGQPGTGKTRLAQAVRTEVQKAMNQRVHFIYRKGQDIASKYFGQSSENLRAVFQEAKDHQPTVLFFDELDGLCPSRDKPFINQASVTIVTTMLGLMDDLPKGKVFVIGATNRLDSIDPAMRRPGRFDKHLEFTPPGEEGRKSILKIHTKGWKVKPQEGLLLDLSKKTVGFSGADLAKLCLDAFDNALNRLIASSKDCFSNADFNKLNVQREDWFQALEKMKPTNSNVFGSSLYSVSTALDGHVKDLLSSSCEQVAKAIRSSLAAMPKDRSKVNALYVCANCEGVVGGIQDLLIDPVLKSEVPIYLYSSDLLESISKNQWASKTSDTFKQALEAPPPVILYIKDPEKLVRLIEVNKYETMLNLPQMVEKLRGNNVLLLACGSQPPTALADGNPFKNALVSNKCLEVESPTDDEREEFFQGCLSRIILFSDKDWAPNDTETVGQIHEELMECTENKEICSLILFHDRLLAAALAQDKNDHKAVIKALWDVIGDFKASN